MHPRRPRVAGTELVTGEGDDGRVLDTPGLIPTGPRSGRWPRGAASFDEAKTCGQARTQAFGPSRPSVATHLLVRCWTKAVLAVERGICDPGVEALSDLIVARHPTYRADQRSRIRL